jgi:hypothetical protein
MSPARLKGAARRCATGLRPALDPADPIQGQAAAGARETHTTLRGAAPMPLPNCRSQHLPPLTQARSTDKQGSAWLRWVLNQAAQTAKRSPEFSASYAAIARRRGKKIATIAVARKLLTRAWHLLSEIQAADASTPPRRP